MRNFRTLPALLLVASSAAVARPPEPQPDNLLNDRLGLQAALSSASVRTRFRYDSDAGVPGTSLGAEDDLGMPDRKVLARADVWFRMRDRHRVRLSSHFVSLERHGDTVLDQPVNFGNEAFFVDERVVSNLDMKRYAASYTYSFVKNERVEAGLSVGGEFLQFDAEAAVPARRRLAREAVSAPAPLVGLDVAGRISGRWYAEARGQYVNFDVREIRGNVATFELNGLYRAHPNVTLGFGWASLRIDIDSRDPGDSGRFALRMRGPQLFGRVGF